MIELHTWSTPNGRKVSIMLEEVRSAVQGCEVEHGRAEQMAPEYLKINPNNKIPAIVDPDGPGGSPFGVGVGRDP